MTSRLLAFTLIFHLFACCWIYLGQFSYSDVNGWVTDTEDKFRGSDMPSYYEEVGIYASSVYFIVTTFTSVGYGDYYGNTMWERVFLLFT